jgi:hypothetical protein
LGEGRPVQKRSGREHRVVFDGRHGYAVRLRNRRAIDALCTGRRAVARKKQISGFMNEA